MVVSSVCMLQVFHQFEGNVIYQYKSDLYTFTFRITKETTPKELKKSENE